MAQRRVCARVFPYRRRQANVLRQTQIVAQQLLELPLELGQRLALLAHLLLGLPPQTVLLHLLLSCLYAGGEKLDGTELL